MIRRGLMFSLAAITVMASLWLWSVAKADPNWDANGWIAYASRDPMVHDEEGVRLFALLPLFGVGVAVLFALLARFNPFRGGPQQSESAYLRLWIGVEALLVVVAIVLAHNIAKSGAAQTATDVGWRGVLAGACLLIMAAADVLPKTRRNFIIGLRTPWTLKNDVIWEKTHRLAGRLLVLAGLAGVIAAFFLETLPLGLFIAALMIAATLTSVAYSYFLWRADPQRTALERGASD